ncbi:hypothetical protein Y025_5736 [Burkholderia pseudomallei TSV32]|nr:hypothetical protein Y025_5736 [Burkholderia pseudomallei TSV32]
MQIAVRARKAHRGWPIVGASAPDLSALTFDPCPRTGPYPALSQRKKAIEYKQTAADCPEPTCFGHA